jgi:cytochrome c oxidase accessory protein FixG
LIALWALLPWIPIGGHPAVFLDIAARRFFLFGASFNAQDTWLLFFLLSGVGFGLVYATAIAGRAWCGWACPQTVFLEGVYRPIQRLVEGPREARIRRDRGPWTLARVARKAVSSTAYAIISFVVAHIILSYFVSLPRVFEMVRNAPAAHPEAFAWAAGMTGLLYFNFARFRERLCTTVCPYGRLQGVLVDADSLVVGYDKKRGEPRGKASVTGAGDCVDCKRCVVVCPTGIDIRDGLQLECIACTACVDACDDVMVKLGRAPGLVRYDSTTGLAGGKRRIVRPRLVLYTVLGIAGVVAATIGFSLRTDYEAVLLRTPGEPYIIRGDDVQNSFDLHLVNKRSSDEAFHLALDGASDASAQIGTPDVRLGGLSEAHVPIVLHLARGAYRGDFKFTVRVDRVGARDTRDVHATFVGARR